MNPLCSAGLNTNHTRPSSISLVTIPISGLRESSELFLLSPRTKYSPSPSFTGFSASPALVIAAPVIIWQVWGFIKPALYPKEKKTFRTLFVIALLLFLLGVAFCYLAVYTLAVDFFLVAGDNLAKPMLSIDKYVSFLFGFIVPFGVAFQLPVALYLTTRMGLTNAKMLASKRKFVILGIFVLAAVLTPPDVVSQLALGLPMILLYEIGILACRLTKPKERE